MTTTNAINPVEPFLRTDRMPHIWCPGCGIGTTVNCFARALTGSQAGPEQSRHGLRHRLHRAGGWLCEPGFVPHHAWPRHSLRHRPQACQSQPQRCGVLR